MAKPKRFYVVGYGSDCDGYDACSCAVFKRLKQAEKYCEGQNEWSDGVRYRVVNKEQAEEYCDGYMRELPEYRGNRGAKKNRKH